MEKGPKGAPADSKSKLVEKKRLPDVLLDRAKDTRGNDSEDEVNDEDANRDVSE